LSLFESVFYHTLPRYFRVAVLDTDELVYFPQDYASNHRGQTKLEVVNNGRICAVPGWSVGLVESLLE